MAQEGTISGRILARERRQRFAALGNRPAQQALGFPAIGTLSFGGFVPVEPGADRLIVVIGLERAHRPRCAEGAARAVDVMWHGMFSLGTAGSGVATRISARARSVSTGWEAKKARI